MAFSQPGPNQQAYGGQFADYSQQARYGGGYGGMLPAGYMPPAAAQYLPPQPGMGGPADGPGYDADALALAQGMNNMVLGPGQYYPQQQRMPAHAGGYPPAGGYGYPPQATMNAPMRGPPMGQQQYQQGPGQQGMGPPMGMNGPPMDFRGPPMQNGRGGGPRGMGPGPRGMGPQQHQQQMQRGGGGRKKVQRGLEDNVRRTVYISYIDQQVRGWAWGVGESGRAAAAAAEQQQQQH